MLPNGWKKLKLGDVAKVTSGGTPLRTRSEYWNGNIPWVKTAQIQNGYISKDQVDEYITELGVKESSAKIVPKGTLLMAMYGQGKTRGQVAILDIDATINQACAAFRLKENDVSTQYLFQYFLFNYENVRNLSNDGGQKNLSAEIIKKIPLDLPPLEEQKKIAATLSVWDSAIEKMEKLIEAKEDQKKSLIWKLIESNDNRKIKLGKVVVDKNKWRKSKLSDVASGFDYGMNAAAKEYDGKNKYIRITDIDDVSHKFNSIDLVSPNAELEDKYRVNEGDILFARTGASTGKSYLYDKKDGVLYFAGFLIRVHVLKDDPFFIYVQTLSSKYQNWLKKMSMRSGQPGVNAEEYKNLPILVPTLPEQNAITEVLFATDKELSLLKQQLENYKKQKQGLMQKLLTGQWQVK